MKKTIKEEWVKEFDKRFCYLNEAGEIRCYKYSYKEPDPEHIKSFIRLLLSKQREELVGEIGKMKNHITIQEGNKSKYYVWYEDVVNLLKSKI
jgi:hypothetical protein